MACGDGNIQYVEQPCGGGSGQRLGLAQAAVRALPIFGDGIVSSGRGSLEKQRSGSRCQCEIGQKRWHQRGLCALKAARKAGLKTMIGCMSRDQHRSSARRSSGRALYYLDLDGTSDHQRSLCPA